MSKIETNVTYSPEPRFQLLTSTVDSSNNLWLRVPSPRSAEPHEPRAERRYSDLRPFCNKSQVICMYIILLCSQYPHEYPAIVPHLPTTSRVSCHIVIHNMTKLWLAMRYKDLNSVVYLSPIISPIALFHIINRMTLQYTQHTHTHKPFHTPSSPTLINTPPILCPILSPCLKN